MRERTRIRRNPGRAAYDRPSIEAVLDAAPVCHVGFAVDGQPYVIPMAYGHDGSHLYLHGSAASRTMSVLADGAEACVTVTVLDGLVLARSAMHHSMNYRSVVLFGQARPITDEPGKREALRLITDHLIPGRWPHIRGPSPQEMKATTVVALPLDQASAKVREGPPVDDDEDLELDVWAGVIPLRSTSADPVADADVSPDTPVPPHVAGYVDERRPRADARA